MNIDYRKMMEEQKNMTPRQRVDYQNEQRQKMIDQQLLRFINNDALHLFVSGGAGSRIPDKDDLAFTNAGVVLNSIYRIFENYPELKIDNLLEQALIRLLNGEIGEFYTALNTLDTQLYNEKRGSSPFKIDDPKVFNVLKENIKINLDYLKNSNAYRGKLYENKLYGYVEEINEKVEDQKGIKIL